MVFDTGTEFLKHYIGSESGFVEAILQTPEYWVWWGNQFEIEAANYFDLDNEADTTRFMHWFEPERIVARPWRKAIDAGYERMISNTIRKEVNHG